MILHHRPLTVFEQVQHEFAACAPSNKRIASIELTREEFNEFCKDASTHLGTSVTSNLLDRGVFSGAEVKVYVEAPDLFTAKAALVEAGTTQPKTEKTEKLTKSIDAIKKRAEVKIIKEKA